MAPKNREIQTTVDTNHNTLSIKTDLGEIFIRLSDLDTGITDHAALQGLKNKIVDAAAMSAGATITDKWNAMQEVVARLTGPEPSWNKGPGAGGAVRGGLLFNALCRMYPNKDVEAVRAYHDKLDKSQQAALRKDLKVAAIIEEIKAESVNTSGVDTDELLSGLEEI